jgi:streptogramin lyase
VKNLNKKALVSVLILLLMPILTLPVQAGANVASDPAPTASVTGYSVDTLTQDLYGIDLTTGVASLIGPLPVGIADMEGLAFDPNTGVLYGVDDTTEKLFTVDPSDGMATEVGDLGVSVIDLGITVDPEGNMWMATESPGKFYSVDKTTGAATEIGSSMGADVTAIAAASEGTIYGLKPSTNELVTIDTATGVATVVGPLNLGITGNAGMDFDAYGVLWAIDQGGNIFTINTLTGEALLIRNTAITGFKSLAIPKPLPPPPDVYQYNFRLNPYVDVFHLNISDCGWIEGIVTTASYTEPLLGRYELGYAIFAWDLPAGGVEMGFAAIKASSGAGSMMRILDDLSVVGPETVWLTWAVTAAAAPAVAGVAMDDVAGLVASVANEEPTLEFQMNPFDDVINLYTDDEAWLWGWADAVGPSYPAPLLGVYGYGRFFYAMDFVDGTGAYELLFAAGSTCSLRGSIVRSPRGFTEDPTPIWLTTP